MHVRKPVIAYLSLSLLLVACAGPSQTVLRPSGTGDIGDLLKVVTDDRAPIYNRLQASRALSRIGSPALEPLLKLFDKLEPRGGVDEDVRLTLGVVTLALGEMGPVAVPAVPRLLRAFPFVDVYVNQAAFEEVTLRDEPHNETTHVTRETSVSYSGVQRPPRWEETAETYQLERVYVGAHALLKIIGREATIDSLRVRCPKPLSPSALAAQPELWDSVWRCHVLKLLGEE